MIDHIEITALSDHLSHLTNMNNLEQVNCRIIERLMIYARYKNEN